MDYIANSHTCKTVSGREVINGLLLCRSRIEDVHLGRTYRSQPAPVEIWDDAEEATDKLHEERLGHMALRPAHINTGFDLFIVI